MNEERLGRAHSGLALLYHDAETSKEMQILLTMSLTTKHKLTYSALGDIFRVTYVLDQCLHSVSLPERCGQQEQLIRRYRIFMTPCKKVNYIEGDVSVLSLI